MKQITKEGDTPIDGIVDIGKSLCITMNIRDGSFSAVAVMNDGSRLKLKELSEGQSIVISPSDRIVIEAIGPADAFYDVTVPKSYF